MWHHKSQADLHYRPCYGQRKTFLDVHQALDWVSALSEAESDGPGDVSWVDSASEGSLFHGHCTLYKFNMFIIIQHYHLSLYLENQ